MNYLNARTYSVAVLCGIVLCVTLRLCSRTYGQGWNLNTVDVDSLPTRLVGTLHAHKNGISHIAFSPDGEMLATSPHTSQLIGDSWQTDDPPKIWNSRGETVAILNNPAYRCTGLAWSSDGRHLFTTQGENIITWSTDTWEKVKYIKCGVMFISEIDCVPTHNVVCAGAENRLVDALGPEWGQTRVELKGRSEYPSQQTSSAVRVSPSGKYIAIAGEGYVNVYDSQTRKTVFGGLVPVEYPKLAWHPNSTIIAVGGYSPTGRMSGQGILRAWDIGTGKILFDTINSETDSYYGLAWQHAGDYIVATASNAIVFSKPTNGQIFHQMRLPGNEPPRCLVFSPDGEILAVTGGSNGGNVYLFGREKS